MTIFDTKSKSTPNRGEALANLRLAIAEAVAAARQSGIDSRQIADILERHADTWRQNDAMTRPVL